MNSLERVMKTVIGEETDRPAFTLLLSLYGAKLTSCPTDIYFSRPESYAEGQFAVREKFLPDLLFSPFALTSVGEAFGSEVKYFSNYAPNIKKPAIKNAPEFLSMDMPDVDSNPKLAFIRNSVRIMAAKYINEVPVVGAIPCPADIPPLVMGIDQWMECLVFDESTAGHIMEKCCDFFIRFGNALLEDGAKIIAFPGMFVNPEIIPSKKIADFILPFLKSAFSQIKGPIVFHHGGNRLEPYIGMFTELPNIVGFAMDSRDSLKEARKKTGDSYVLLGNIDGPTLSEQTPEQTQKLCMDILNSRENDKKFILASSAADIPWNTPEENIMAICDCVRNYRRS